MKTTSVLTIGRSVQRAVMATPTASLEEALAGARPRPERASSQPSLAPAPRFAMAFAA